MGTLSLLCWNTVEKRNRIHILLSTNSGNPTERFWVAWLGLHVISWIKICTQGDTGLWLIWPMLVRHIYGQGSKIYNWKLNCREDKTIEITEVKYWLKIFSFLVPFFFPLCHIVVFCLFFSSTVIHLRRNSVQKYAKIPYIYLKYFWNGYGFSVNCIYFSLNFSQCSYFV